MKYTSGRRSATCAAWRHQSAAVPPVYGADGRSRKGRAPFELSACRSARTFARYWAFDGVHGVVVPGPNSSFRPMIGVWQREASTARLKTRSAAAGIVAASLGAAVVPTRSARRICQYTVFAAPARSFWGTVGPPCVAAITPGRAKTWLRNETEPSLNSIHHGCVSGRPHWAAGALGAEASAQPLTS